MKAFLAFLLVITGTALFANPVVLHYASEIQVSDSGWTLEISILHGFNITQAKITNASGDSVIVNSLVWNDNDVALVSSANYPLTINPAHDSVYVQEGLGDNQWGTDIWEGLSWGNSEVPAPTPEQSIINYFYQYDEGSNYLSALEGSPTLGSMPYQCNSPGSVNGYITDANGTPIAGAIISCGQFNCTPCTTGADGYYTLTGLPARAYTLLIRIGSAYQANRSFSISPNEATLVNCHLTDYTATDDPVVQARTAIKVNNPVHAGENLHFSLPVDQQTYRVSVYDARGQRIEVFEGVASQSALSVPLKSGLANGIYLYRVTSRGQSWQGKFTILK